MLREIGSNFWLPEGEKNKSSIDKKLFNVDFEDIVYTSSGRSAISLVLSELEDGCKRALLPSYTCESVIEPFIKQGYDIAFYSVDEKLEINKDIFCDEIQNNNPSVVLIHNYFGFDTTSSVKEIISEARIHGIIVIEDITQNLYSTFPRLPADYYVGSFRKWVGLPDGGFAIKAKGEIVTRPTQEDLLLTETKLKAMKAKYDYIFYRIGDKQAFLQLFFEAEELLEKQEKVFRMSDASYREQANLSIDTLKKRRRENFAFLLDTIRHSKIKPLFTFLPENVTPLYFPVLCNGERTSLQSLLRNHQIYAPVIWPKADYISDIMAAVDYVYDNLLCIPCDQRYGLEEMERINSVING